MEITFTVYGRPQPQGSTRSFTVRTARGPQTVVTSANKKLRPWRQELSRVALEAMACAWSSGQLPDFHRQGISTVIGRPVPISLSVEFYFARPVSLAKKVRANVKQPDLDKLARAVCDALTGICYESDAQVNQLLLQKSYGSPERTEVKVLPRLPHLVFFQRQEVGEPKPAQQRMAL